MAWPDDEEELGGPMSPSSLQSGLSAEEPAPAPEVPFSQTPAFRPLSPKQIAQEQEARDRQAAKEEKARQSAEAEAERTRRTVETKRLREQGVELTVDDQNQAVPVTREDGSKVFKSDWVGAPRFDADKRSWVRDRRDDRGNVAPVDLWDNKSIQRDDETGDLFFNHEGVRTVVGKDEDFLKIRSLKKEMDQVEIARKEEQNTLARTIQELAPLEEGFKEREKQFQATAQKFRNTLENARKIPKWADANSEIMRAAQEAYEAERKAFDPIRKQKAALEARKKELNDAILTKSERHISLYKDRVALEAAARRPEFAAPAAPPAGETPDVTAERETHGAGGDAYRLPDVAREETEFRDRMRKLDVEAERLAPPAMALAPDPAREAKLAEINARRKEEIKAFAGRKAAVERFQEEDAALTTALAQSEGRERALVWRYSRDEAPLGRDLAAGRITLEQYQKAVGELEANIARESAGREALQAERAKIKKATWAALREPAEFPETLLRRSGGEVDLDPRAVELRATGRAAALGTSEGQELYEVLLEIKDGGAIQKIGGRPIAEVIREVGAANGLRVADLLTADEQRAVAEGLKGGLVGLQKGIFGTEYGDKLDLVGDRLVKTGLTADERRPGTPALDGQETLTRPVSERDEAIRFWGQLMASGITGAPPAGGMATTPGGKPKSPLAPYQEDILRQRDEIQGREFQPPANWGELSAADKRAALEDFQSTKAKALEVFYDRQAAMGGDRADFVKELRGEKPMSFPAAVIEELTGRVRAALVSPYAGVQDVSLGLVDTLALVEAKALGIDPEQSTLRQFAQGARAQTADAMGEKADTLLAQIGRGAGSSLAFASVSPGGLGAVAGLGAASQFGSGYFEAKDRAAGKKLSDTQLYLNALATAGLGATEGLPMARALNRLDKLTGGAFKRLLDIGKETVEEGAQEFFQSAYQGYLYKLQGLDDRSWEEIRGEALTAGGVAALSGLLLGVGMNFAAERSDRSRTAKLDRAFGVLDTQYQKLQSAQTPEGLAAFNAGLPEGTAALTPAKAADLLREVQRARASAAVQVLANDPQILEATVKAIAPNDDAEVLAAAVRGRPAVLAEAAALGRDIGPSLPGWTSIPDSALKKVVAGHMLIGRLQTVLTGGKIEADLGQALEQQGFLIQQPTPQGGTRWVVTGPALVLMEGDVRRRVTKNPAGFAYAPAADTARPGEMSQTLRKTGDRIVSTAVNPAAPSSEIGQTNGQNTPGSYKVTFESEPDAKGFRQTRTATVQASSPEEATARATETARRWGAGWTPTRSEKLSDSAGAPAYSPGDGQPVSNISASQEGQRLETDGGPVGPASPGLGGATGPTDMGAEVAPVSGGVETLPGDGSPAGGDAAGEGGSGAAASSGSESGDPSGSVRVSQPPSEAEYASPDAAGETALPWSGTRDHLGLLKRVFGLPGLRFQNTTKNTRVEPRADGTIVLHWNASQSLNPDGSLDVEYDSAVIDEELRHAAFFLAKRKEWEAAGKPAPFTEWVQKDATAMWRDLMARIGQLEGAERRMVEEALVGSFNAYFIDANAEQPHAKTLADVEAAFGQKIGRDRIEASDFNVLTEFARQIAQLRNVGQITEATAEGLIGRIMEWFRAAVRSMRAIARQIDAEGNPLDGTLFQQAYLRMEAETKWLDGQISNAGYAEMIAEIEEGKDEALASGAQGSELLTAIEGMGKLPSPTSPYWPQWEGELRQVWDAVEQLGRGNLRDLRRFSKYRIFSPSAPDPDVLRFELEQHGFTYETVDDMLVALERRITSGRPEYGFRSSDAYARTRPEDRTTARNFLTGKGIPRSVLAEAENGISRSLAQIRALGVAEAYQGDFTAQLFAPSQGAAANRSDAARTRSALRLETLGDIREALDRGPVSSLVQGMVTREIPGFDVRGAKIERPADFAALLLPLRSPYFESVKVAFLDAEGTVVHSQILHVGSLNESVAHPRDLLQSLQAAQGTRAIIAHNHPSGDPKPSTADRQVTKMMREALDMAGIELVDHVITNGETFYSLQNEEELPISGGLAPWEAVPRSDLRKLANTPDLVEALARLRQGDPGHRHAIYVSTRNTILGIERLPAGAAARRAVALGVAREGAKGFFLDLGETNESIAPFRELASQLSVDFLDASSAETPSFQAAGLMFRENPSDSAPAPAYTREDDTLADSTALADELALEPAPDSELGRSERDAVEAARRYVSRLYPGSAGKVTGYRGGLRGESGGNGTDAVFAALQAALHAAFGRRIVFVSGIPRGKLEAAIFPQAAPDVIVVNKDARYPLLHLLGHELGHSIKAGNPELYREFQSFILSLAGDRAAHNRHLEERGYPPEKWDDEFVNDFLGNEFGQKGFWQALADKDATLFRRVAMAALALIDRIKKRILPLARDVRPMITDLDAARAGVVAMLDRFAKEGDVGATGGWSPMSDADLMAGEDLFGAPSPIQGQAGTRHRPRKIVEGFMSPDFAYEVLNNTQVPAGHRLIASRLYERRIAREHPLFRLNLIETPDGGRYVAVERGMDMQANPAGARTRFERIRPDDLEYERKFAPVNDAAAALWREFPASSEKPFKKNSTQLDLPPDIARAFVEYGRSIPEADLYTAEPGYGREEEPHVTVLYGIEATPQQVAEVAQKVGPVELRFGKTSLFESENYDVLKVDIEGPRPLNAALNSAHPTPSDFPDYRPHATVAYLKKGAGKKYVGDGRFEGLRATVSELTFSAKDRSKTRIPLRTSEAGEDGQLSLFARTKFSNATVEGPGVISLYARTAYHGTPHKVDRFSTEKVGTGEGAQAYGWGLYFAEEEMVAEEYRKRLSGEEKIRPDAKAQADYKQQWESVIQEINNRRQQEPREHMRDLVDVSDLHAKLDKLNEQALRDTIQRMGGRVDGNLYTVELDVEPEDLLDWDKPLSDQSEKVKRSLEVTDWYQYAEDQLEGLDNPDGRRLYKWLLDDWTPEEASAQLLSAGIPGIRYLDRNSRDGGSGTYNYVIFDESKIRILEENGEPVDAATRAALFARTRPAESLQFDFGLSGTLNTRDQTAFEFSAPQPAAQSVSVEPSPVETGTVQTGGPLVDFGDKLGGARKDRSLDREFSDEDLAGKPLSEIWPKAEVDGIEDLQLAAVAHAMRSEIPSKPRKGYKLNRWVEQVKAIRSLMRYAQEAGFDAILAKMEERRLDQFTAKIRLLSAIDRGAWDRVEEVRWYPDAIRYVQDEDGRPQRNADGTSKTVSAAYASAKVDGQRVTAANLTALAEKVREMTASGEKPQTRMQFEVRGTTDGKTGIGTWRINKKGDPLYRALKTFTDAKEAFAYIRNNYDDLVQAWEAVKERENVRERDLRRDVNRPRTAEDYRQGRDVTPEMFSEAFGFRGVEFGNWVAQGANARERQGMLNQAFDALMDLAAIMQVPSRALSLNGDLGLAFGSRGHGWASAHYEPGRIVINLTKTRGAGTLAHEFFHALDHYFQRQRNPSGINGNEGDYITEQPETYWQSPAGVRLSEARYLQLKAEPYNRMEGWKKIEGVRPEVAEAFAALVRALDASPMAKRARLIDKGKSDGYWSSVIERAARAFENYVIFKMQQRGYHNDYLANVVSPEEFSRDAGRYPYLLESELQPVAEAFDDLFSTLKTRETERGVALYARTRPRNEETPSSFKTGAASEEVGLTGGTGRMIRILQERLGVSENPEVFARTRPTPQRWFDFGVAGSQIGRYEMPLTLADGMRGATDAEQGLFARHIGLAYSIAGKYQNAGELDDIRQEALIALTRAARTFRPQRGAFATWAGTIIRNHLNGVYRARPEETDSLDAPLGDSERTLEDIVPGEGASPAESAQTSDTAARVRAAVASLPDDLRDVMQARLAGRTLEEIGRTRGVTKQTISGMEKVAMGLLRRRLKAQGIDGVYARTRPPGLPSKSATQEYDDVRKMSKAQLLEEIGKAGLSKQPKEALVGLALRLRGASFSDLTEGEFLSSHYFHQVNPLSNGALDGGPMRGGWVLPGVRRGAPVTAMDGRYGFEAGQRVIAVPVDQIDNLEHNSRPAQIRQGFTPKPDEQVVLRESDIYRTLAPDGTESAMADYYKAFSSTAAEAFARTRPAFPTGQEDFVGALDRDIFPTMLETAPPDPVRPPLSPDEADAVAAEVMRDVQGVADEIARVPAEELPEDRKTSLRDHYNRHFRGRFDKLNYFATGSGDVLLDTMRDNAMFAAAMRRFVESVEEKVKAAFGHPSLWRGGANAKRLRRFKAEILPFAAALNPVRRDGAGDFVFEGFWQRSGELSGKQVENMGRVPGEEWVDGAERWRITGYVAPDPKRPKEGFYQLERWLPAEVQERLHEEFHDRFPEAAFVLDDFIEPGQEDARVVSPQGIELPTFNRHSLYGFYGDTPAGLVERIPGYTPDVARTKSLAGVAAKLLKLHWKSPGRDYKSGQARVTGQVRDLFEGFNTRAAQAHAESARREAAEKLLRATMRPVPEAGLPPDYVRIDRDTLNPLIRAFRAASKAGQSDMPEIMAGATDQLTQRDLETLKMLFGDPSLFDPAQMVHREVLAELERGFVRLRLDNAFLDGAMTWLRGSVAGVLADFQTLTINKLSNYIFHSMRAMQRVAYAGLSAAAGEKMEARQAIREAGFQMRGFFTNFFHPAIRERMDRMVPGELFEDQNLLRVMLGDAGDLSVTDLLRQANVGGAFLKAVGYGEMDVRAKQKLALASLMARASIAADEAGISGPGRMAWMREWVENAPVEARREAEAAAKLFLMDYANVPWWLDEGRRIEVGGHDVTPWVNLVRALSIPFWKFPYNYLRQMKKLGVDSVRDLTTRSKRTDSKQKREAAANLITLAMVHAAFWLLTNPWDPEDEAPVLGRDVDDAGEELDIKLRTSSRVRLAESSMLGNVVGTAARLFGAEPTDDLWARVRTIPYATQSLFLGAMLEFLSNPTAGGGKQSMSAAWDILEDFMSVGSGARLGLTFMGFRDDYTRYQEAPFMLSQGVFDLATARVLPPRALRDVATLIDPVNRRYTAATSLDYQPGAWEGILSRVPGATKLLPPSGKVQSNADPDSPKTRQARAELEAMGLADLAYREYLNDDGKLRAAYVRPEMIYKVPAWRALVRQGGFNVKNVPAADYNAALAGVEE